MAKAIDRGLENREIVLGVLTEVLDKGNFVHLVLNQALSKYQYLEKPDRAFITRVTEGTLEYLLQIDYIINSYSKTKTEKMKPLIRNILRMSVYNSFTWTVYQTVLFAMKQSNWPYTTIFRG